MPTAEESIKWVQTRAADLWHALWSARVRNACLLILILAFLGYQAEAMVTSHPAWPAWLRVVPFRSIADALFIASIVALTFEYFVRVEAKAELMAVFEETLQRVVAEERRETQDTIRSSLLFDGDIQRRLLNEQTLDQILRTCIQTKLRDVTMGTQVSDGPLARMLGHDRRWRNYKFSAMLSSVPAGHALGARAQEFFQATIVVRYETTSCARQLRFVTVRTVDEFNRALLDPEVEMAWLMPLDDGVDSSQYGMVVDEVIVANAEWSRKGAGPNHQAGEELWEPAAGAGVNTSGVVVYYKLRTLLYRSGHSYHVAIPYPTQNCVIELDFAKADVDHVDVIEYFPSSRPAIVRYLPSVEDCRKIEVEVGEWVFPKAGAIFVWSLKGETARPRRHRAAGA